MEASADPGQALHWPCHGILARERRGGGVSAGASLSGSAAQPCVTDTALWPGFLVICIFSCKDSAEQEVVKGPAQRGCSEMFVASSRRSMSGLPPPFLSSPTEEERRA